MQFDDPAFAARFRGIVRKIVTGVLDEERPRYQYATVISFNRTTRKCVVRYPGSLANGTQDVTVNMGSVQPSAVGQTVRIAGQAGDKFIEDVMGLAHGVSLSTMSTTDPGNDFRGSVNHSSKSLNQWLTTGVYNGDNMVGAPDNTWWYVHVLQHNNGTATNGGWHRQVAYGMTGDRSILTRWTSGGDPTVVGNWTAWQRVVDGASHTYWRNIGAGGEPAFQSGWGDYGGGYGTPQFRKDSAGNVHMRGLMSGGAGGTAFTLPVGYRPQGLTIFPSSAGDAFATFEVHSTGPVAVRTLPTNAWFSIACSFPAHN